MRVKLDEFLCPFHLTWRDCDMYFWKHDRVRFIIDVKDTHLQFCFEDFLSNLYTKVLPFLFLFIYIYFKEMNKSIKYFPRVIF